MRPAEERRFTHDHGVLNRAISSACPGGRILLGLLITLGVPTEATIVPGAAIRWNIAAHIRRTAVMQDQHWQGFSYALFACVGLVICATFLDYGLTWDEEMHVNHGYHVLKWYSSFFH